MNTSGNVGIRVGEAIVGRNQDPSRAPAARVQVLINPTALTDGEVREALVQMDQPSLLKHRLSQPKPLERVLPERIHMLETWLAD